MHRVKIYIVSHKRLPIPKDNVYEPIYVGKESSLSGIQKLEGIKDNIGDNISTKNSSYCEMTAHYWIWKNVHDVEFVGLCHYRRYFGVDITDISISSIMNGYDVVMVEPSWHLDSVYAYFAKYIGAENMTILWMVMKKMHPDYVNTLELVCDGVKFYPFNMLLCKKTLFDEYAEWIFSILEECEKYVKTSPYTNGRRALAYMAELLTGIYFIHRGLKIKTVPYYKIEDGNRFLISRTADEEQLFSNFENLRHSIFAQKVQIDRAEKFINPAILLGLKKDGIVIE